MFLLHEAPNVIFHNQFWRTKILNRLILNCLIGRNSARFGLYKTRPFLLLLCNSAGMRGLVNKHFGSGSVSKLFFIFFHADVVALFIISIYISSHYLLFFTKNVLHQFGTLIRILIYSIEMVQNNTTQFIFLNYKRTASISTMKSNLQLTWRHAVNTLHLSLSFKSCTIIL